MTKWDILSKTVYPFFVCGYALMRQPLFRFAGLRIYFFVFFIDWMYNFNAHYELLLHSTITLLYISSRRRDLLLLSIPRHAFALQA